MSKCQNEVFIACQVLCPFFSVSYFIGSLGQVVGDDTLGPGAREACLRILTLPFNSHVTQPLHAPRFSFSILNQDDNVCLAGWL